MGKTGGKKLQTFCVNRIRPLVKVPIPNKLGTTSPHRVKKTDVVYNQVEETDTKFEENSQNLKAVGRKIMVVVDSSAEAKVALQWTLTHTAQSCDSIVLLYVTKLNSKHQEKEATKMKLSPKVYELLHSLKKTCQFKRPEVEVEVKMAEGKEKGPTIVEEARKQDVSLLVLGQKKQSTTWRLLLMWASNTVAGGGSGGGMVEYCIQNASCMALAVRRKSKRVGGYLITTKRHKDFWLLA